MSSSKRCPVLALEHVGIVAADRGVTTRADILSPYHSVIRAAQRLFSMWEIDLDLDSIEWRDGVVHVYAMHSAPDQLVPAANVATLAELMSRYRAAQQSAQPMSMSAADRAALKLNETSHALAVSGGRTCFFTAGREVAYQPMDPALLRCASPVATDTVRIAGAYVTGYGYAAPIPTVSMLQADWVGSSSPVNVFLDILHNDIARCTLSLTNPQLLRVCIGQTRLTATASVSRAGAARLLGAVIMETDGETQTIEATAPGPERS